MALRQSSRAQTISSHKVKVKIVRTVYGFSGVTVILHNTATENGKLAVALPLRDNFPMRLLTSN